MSRCGRQWTTCISRGSNRRAVAFGSAARRIGRAVAVAFGWKPTLVTNIAKLLGVQYGGQAMGRGAHRSECQTPIHQGVPIQTIFHETTQPRKSQDAQDKSDYAALREVVLRYAKPDAVRARVAKEVEIRPMAKTRSSPMCLATWR